ncbi:hypothetical protein UAJ10_23310 [Nitrospirillum sp. BR 11164]|uniref:glycoside hydrolase family 38 N-terminal domain-containing protein n=1 Tax=Nitrospirillum sp. BR 11164 TaxID=3104324 RepID=UPI002AFFC549|nr:hypothetical protein [Nitrospirillum sp. BR 11164]MEA1651927.1 hypothetical protein [Nitrospirillum sp. BR 11164]
MSISPYTMYLDQSAHLDWDWLYTFEQNFWYYKYGQGVKAILDQAITNVSAPTVDGVTYYYTICEMGYFKRYIDVSPEQVGVLQAVLENGDTFQVLGGGITSPDCLVCAGEAFLRNYLMGHVWLSQALPFITPKPHCWIPDDFGQDPELPVLTQALGFTGIGFSRLPGSNSSCPVPDPIQSPAGQDWPATHFDFTWQASDGSTAITHWMPDSYAFGNQLGSPAQATQISLFTNAYLPTQDSDPVQYGAAATPYLYIPIDNDFSMPLTGLPAAVTQWNDNQVAGGGAQATNVEVTLGTFDTFITQLRQNQDSYPLPLLAPYNGTPYWTGYYASRMALKTLHNRALRALVAAEVFGLLTRPNDTGYNNALPTGFWDDLAAAWMAFLPSTHHDYVCGTANDAVYATEQLPLLRGVAGTAAGLRATALNALASMMAPSDETYPVLVANSLGFARTGLVAIPDVAVPNLGHVTFGTTQGAAQISSDGEMLFMATVDSLGYDATGSLSAGAPDKGATRNGTSAVSITCATDGSYVLQNDYLIATISPAANWGIESLVDQSTSTDILSGTGNDIVFYADGGGLYQFGDEYVDGDYPFHVDTGVTVATSGPCLGAVMLETGPVRVRLRTVVAYTVSGATVRYTRDYELVAGEPFLRMVTTGPAPSLYSVMTRFPLSAAVTGLVHGTPYHWTSQQPLRNGKGQPFWGPPTFQATHNFVLPQDQAGDTLAALYHGGIPAWAFDADAALISCLARNTPTSGGHGADGTDTAVHTQAYALRVPGGLGTPESGAPLQEALSYNTPLQGALLPSKTGVTKGLPSRDSVAAVTGGTAILTVAKPGSFAANADSVVLRLYTPANQSQDVTLSLGAGLAPTQAVAVTAAEGAWPGPNQGVALTGGTVTLTMTNALATVQLT